MRTLFTMFIVAVSVSNATPARSEDSLFSEVAMESVFEKNVPLTASVASQGSGETLERVTGASSLMLALKFAGYSPKQVENRVSLQVEHAGWKLPVAMEVELEQDRIVCEMSLIDIPDSSKIDSSAILKLLEKSDAASGYFFAYDAKSKVIQLRSSFSNRAITAKQLKSNLIQMGTFADSHSEVWSKLKSKPATTVAESAGKTSTTTTASTTVSTTQGQTVSPLNVSLANLVGLWGATLKSGESIAIQLSADNSFKLATVKSGKSSISKGKATLAGNKLTLIGDDKVTMNCTIAQVTSTKFQMAINDQNGKAKLTIEFVKSK